MDVEDDDIGNVSSFGLGRILAQSGIDTSSLGNLLGGAGGSNSAYAELDASDDENAKYMDDELDTDLPGEGEGEVERRRQQEAHNRAMEERYVRKAMEMQRELAVKGKAPSKTREEQTVEELGKAKRIWPDFSQGMILKMSEVFFETPAMTKAHQAELARKKRRRIEPAGPYALSVAPSPADPSNLFQQPGLADIELDRPGAPRYSTKIGTNFDKTWVKAAKARKRALMSKPPGDINLSNAFETMKDGKLNGQGRPLDLANWEKDIVMFSLDRPSSKRQSDAFEPLNQALDSGDWMKEIIWDARRVSPDLVESDDEVEVERPKPTLLQGKAKLDPFNISNDHLYEHSREARFRIRQTFGAIEVFHAYPAKILQMPWYKTTLSKVEARAWRRPALQFPVGVSLGFSKLKSNPSATVSSKKKQMLADPSERFKSTKDLTMAEKGPFVLLEFSEEYPPIMSGYGMGTTIVNYYRKKDDKDEHVPKLDLGQPSILNVGDAEPFLLGYVDRGQVTQIIHNNLIRAPIFKHQPETTDFLMIRQTINGHSTYYLRPISHLYTVGQTVPNESEVPGPHARKNTNTAKLRLQIVAWLLLNRSKNGRIKLSKLIKYFPDQTELKIRQRLNIKGNEFLEYARGETGDRQGHWMLSPTYDFPKERKVVQEKCTPESAMLFEAMLAGQRHLYDAGYTKTAEGNANEEFDDDTGMDIEQQLAVWFTTLNYKKAEAQKAWLVVHGEGDPTGRGEGFSFLKTNMKSYFLRKGETEQGRRLEAQRNAPSGAVAKISNAEQGRIYEEEKRRVWDLQWSSLSNPSPPSLSQEDEARNSAHTTQPTGFGPRFVKTETRRGFSRGDSTTATPMFADSPAREMSPSAFSADDSTFTGNNPVAGRVMRIKRVIKGKTHYEIVRDPQVIQSYLRRIEDRKLSEYQRRAENLRSTGDAAEDELRRTALQRELERLKKNQQRRMARKKYSAKELEPVDGDVEGKRKCGACGQIGHTKANRNCPMFKSTSLAPSPVASTPQAPTPGFEYFGAPPTGGGGEQTPGTSFKIRLGAGR